MVMKYLDEMDDNPRGAYIDDLYRKGEEDGIPAQKIDEITDRLMDKGVIYEPNLGYLKKI